MIREYIKAVHKHALALNNLTTEKLKYINWATDKADWLDPLINKRDKILDAE